MSIEYIIKRKIKKLLGMDEIKFSLEREYSVNYDEYKEFDGKVVVVTGGSGALGRAICLGFASHGAKVYIAGRNIEKINAVISEIEKLQCGSAFAMQLDVTRADSIEDSFEELFKNEKRIDVLINCAGGGAREKAKNLVEQGIDIIDSVIMSNLRGTILCCRKAAQMMIRQKSGKIINFCSSIGLCGMKTCVDYSATKSGMLGLTMSLAKELGPFNVNVNCVSPGYIERDDFSEIRAEWMQTTNILHKIGTYEDVSNAVLFLSSEKAGFITGQNLVIDGGRTISLCGTD